MRKLSLVILATCVLSPLLARADDDPEPPGKGGTELRNLRGKWIVVGMKWKGKEVKPPAGDMTYHFDGDKVTVKNTRLEYVAKVKVDAKKKPPILELTREDTKTTTKHALKADKGRLLLASTSLKSNVKGDEDFSGDVGMVLMLEREKKDK